MYVNFLIQLYKMFYSCYISFSFVINVLLFCVTCSYLLCYISYSFVLHFLPFCVTFSSLLCYMFFSFVLHFLFFCVTFLPFVLHFRVLVSQLFSEIIWGLIYNIILFQDILG